MSDAINLAGLEAAVNQRQNEALEQRGYRASADFLFEHLFPTYQEDLRRRLSSAKDTNELLQVQGAQKLLDRMIQTAKSRISGEADNTMLKAVS